MLVVVLRRERGRLVAADRRRVREDNGFPVLLVRQGRSLPLCVSESRSVVVCQGSSSQKRHFSRLSGAGTGHSLERPCQHPDAQSAPNKPPQQPSVRLFGSFLPEAPQIPRLTAIASFCHSQMAQASQANLPFAASTSRLQQQG